MVILPDRHRLSVGEEIEVNGVRITVANVERHVEGNSSPKWRVELDIVPPKPAEPDGQ